MTLVLTWLGHAGFRLSSDVTVVLVDPWLSPHPLRTVAPPAVDELGDRIDWVFATHEHDDHLDLPTLRQLAVRHPGLCLIAPAPLGELAVDACPGLEFRGVQPGDHLSLPGITVDVVSAKHAVAMSDGYSDSCDAAGEARFVGYVIDIGGIRAYHAGDALASDASLTELDQLDIDVALLPVNGRDYFRERSGIVGNMHAVEAAQTAVAIGAQTLVPMHYGAIHGNGGRAGAAADAVNDLGLPLNVLTLAPMLPFSVPPSLRTCREAGGVLPSGQ